MKKIIKYTLVALLSASAVACTEDSLNTAPTTSMSGESLFSTAGAALVPLNGLYRSMYTAGWSTTGNTHQCFGISAYNLMADVMADDHIMSGQGSGWFWFDCLYNVKPRYTSGAWRSYDLWNAYYTWISNANYIIAYEETMGGSTADVNSIMGQAYTIRAYSYFMLAQSFARTYVGHESDPCAPIYTEPTVAGTQGKPRSTVKEVYEQITSDINHAVTLLESASPKKHISHFDLASANGIKARIALVMEDWNTAFTAATAAINASSCKIGTGSDLFSGMNNADANNVMWGAQIISDQAGMYASLFAHMQGAKYHGNTARKQITKPLYAKMGREDVRREWWNTEDPANGSKTGYQQVKFDFADISIWTGDYIWMRIEEMYLMAAEAACQKGDDATARQYLETFMAKRDPNYTAVNKSGKAMGALTSDETGSLLEAIIDQRRIELWGEFGRIYDIRRLKQGFKRTEAMGWPTAALLNSTDTQNPESYAWVLTIPQAEFDGNANMTLEADQNPIGDHK